MRQTKVALALILLLTALALHAEQARQAQPAPPSSDSSLRFAIIGDTGTGGSAEYQVAERLTAARAQFPFEFVIMVGDNVYGTDSPSGLLNKFERPYKALLNLGTKFFAALGNHDTPEVQINYKLFNMGGKRFYTFKPKPGVRFLALDSNYVDKAQLEWLEKELKASGSEWKVLFFHHPIYSSGEKHGSNVELRSVLEPLMLKYGVDVVFTGHEHFYERLKAQKGINYFIVGSSAKLRKGNIDTRSGITAKGFDQDYVFMLAEIAGDEMRFQTVTRATKVVDSGAIRRAELKGTATAQ